MAIYILTTIVCSNQIKTPLQVKMSKSLSKIYSLVKDELIVLDPTELIGRRLDFMVMIPQCTSVRWTMEENSRGVYTG